MKSHILHVGLLLAATVLGPLAESLLLGQESKKTPPVQRKDTAGKKIDDRQRIVGTWHVAKMQSNGVDTPPQGFRVTFTEGGACILSMDEKLAAAKPAAEQWLPFRIKYVLVWPGEIEFPALPGGTKSGIGIYKFDGDDRLTIC
jgi:hypothetical protein